MPDGLLRVADVVVDAVFGWPESLGLPPWCRSRRAYPCVVAARPDPEVANASLRVQRRFLLHASPARPRREGDDPEREAVGGGGYGLTVIEAAAAPATIAAVRASAAVVRGVGMTPRGLRQGGRDIFSVTHAAAYPAWFASLASAPFAAAAASFSEEVVRLTSHAAAVRDACGPPPSPGGVPVGGQVLGCDGSISVIIPWWEDTSTATWPSGRSPGTPREFIEVVGSLIGAAVIDPLSPGGPAPVWVQFLAVGLARVRDVSSTRGAEGRARAGRRWGDEELCAWGALEACHAAAAAPTAADARLVAMSRFLQAGARALPRLPPATQQAAGLGDDDEDAAIPVVRVVQPTLSYSAYFARYVLFDVATIGSAVERAGFVFKGQVVASVLPAAALLRVFATPGVVLVPFSSAAAYAAFAGPRTMVLELSPAGAAQCWVRGMALAHGRFYSEAALPRIDNPDLNGLYSAGMPDPEVATASLVLRDVDMLTRRLRMARGLIFDWPPGGEVWGVGDVARRECGQFENMLCVNTATPYPPLGWTIA